MMKRQFLFFFWFLSPFIIWAQVDTAQKITEGRVNSPEQQEKPYVILISGDGFRYDYMEKYQAKNLLELSGKGIRAAAMIPSYPSLTFPNHYTIATGLYPSHHGLVSNYFYDPDRGESYGMRNQKTVRDGTWYGGTPLWALAEQQQMLTASFYWVGSEANIKGLLPTYYYAYNELIPIDRRIKIVTNWLQLPADRRPHLITFYFPEVDHKGHEFGPDAPQTAEAVRWLDSSIKKLTNAVKAIDLPVNFIFVSDHGMTRIDNENPVQMPAVDSNKFVISRSSELVELYARNKSDINPTYDFLKSSSKGFATYLKGEMPDRLHYGEKDDRMHRIGDILLVPNWPQVFSFSSRKPSPGAHGFDPGLVRDMLASFYAWGPAFKKHLKIQAFENVNVYPVVTTILGLNVTEGIDGSSELAMEILKKKAFLRYKKAGQ